MTWRPWVPITCVHDGDAGTLASGLPRCPSCRRLAARYDATHAVPRGDPRAAAAGDLDDGLFP